MIKAIYINKFSLTLDNHCLHYIKPSKKADYLLVIGTNASFQIGIDREYLWEFSQKSSTNKYMHRVV